MLLRSGVRCPLSRTRHAGTCEGACAGFDRAETLRCSSAESEGGCGMSERVVSTRQVCKSTTCSQAFRQARGTTRRRSPMTTCAKSCIVK